MIYDDLRRRYPNSPVNLQLHRERKPLDPALKLYLEEFAGGTPGSPATPETAENRRAVMNRALNNRTSIPGLPNQVQSRHITISPHLRARLFTPLAAATSLPALLYMHGGGWVVGSIETHEPFCRLLCEAAGIQILLIDFRLAPENPFPASLEDTVTAWHWLVQHAREIGADPRRLAVGGDSAGANLATVAAERICASVESVLPAAQLLLFPVTDHPSAGHPSYRECATGCGLDASVMQWFWNQYVTDALAANPEVSPLRRKQTASLVPTLIATAEHDPLRDEGIAYAEKLVAAGAPVMHLHYSDMHHNFPVHPGTVARFPQSIEAHHEFANWLKNALGKNERLPQNAEAV